MKYAGVYAFILDFFCQLQIKSILYRQIRQLVGDLAANAPTHATRVRLIINLVKKKGWGKIKGMPNLED